jgi:hypothetical protein
MANSLRTPQELTRESVRILHQKLNFIGNINRQYDNRFARDGAKIGDTLQIRLPNQYTVRTGRVIDVQDTNEQKVDLVVSTQKGVDTSFTSTDLTLDLQDFSKRILEPAMAVLAANIEADAFNMLDDVYQVEDRSGSSVQFSNVLNTRKLLRDSLAPMNDNKFIMDTQANVDLVDALKGLFQDSSQIAKQYREGMIGRTANFEFFENTLLPAHTTGGWNANYDIKTAPSSGDTTLDIDTGTGTIKKGDVFTIAGINRVHPETKADTGVLQQFVATADSAGGDVEIGISPAIISTGPRQNVSDLPADADDLVFVGSNNTAHNRAVAFHPDAFTFATADLEMPDGVHFAAREVFDGLSLRIVRQYDVNNDTFPCRIDILYGYKTIRPELAAILAAN